ncbi:cation:proton antiporter [Candidatus Thorarchaeota archaeon]|nr:MAG: cation:proton antiporter [Candidatus Thorarchaeota archaeon]
MKTSDFLLSFFLIAIILTFIKASQFVSRRFDLPDVLGELLVGIILGPTALGVLYLAETPTSSLGLVLGISQENLVGTARIITFISEFAVLLLLFKVGLEVDFEDLKRVRTPAVITATTGILLPLIGGVVFVLGIFGIGFIELFPAETDIWQTAVFVGIILTATSIGISTRIFCDCDRLRSRVAQTVVCSAIFDDIIAVALFSIIVAYFGSAGSFNPLGLPIILLNIIMFFAISYLLYRYILPFFFSKINGNGDKSLPIFVSIGFMLYMATLAQALGLAPIIGAFMAGVIIGNEEGFLDVNRDFEPISSWVIPFFFLTIGLGVNLVNIWNFFIIILALILVSIAILTKHLAGIIGTKVSGYSKGESRIVGLSMAARGEVTLFFAYTGFSLGYFTQAFYGVLILSVILIPFIVIPLLKSTIMKWIPEQRENETLEEISCNMK